MNEFKTYHPIVNFIYFLAVLGFSMFFLHPVCIGISLVCGYIYLWFLGGGKAIRTSLNISIPIILISGVINTAFNHAGVTVIAHFPNGNLITLESIVYGLIVGGMISTAILWFSCYNRIMTEDKFIYLFGRVSPSFALVVSMTLRFVPQFLKQFKRVTEVQRSNGRDVKKGKVKDRVKTATEIMSIMTTWALERSVTTSDSMKARGYGVKKRTAFSLYRFSARDAVALCYIIIMGAYIMLKALSGAVKFQCFPCIRISMTGISAYISYFLLLIFPVIVEIKEGWKWKSLRRKI